MSIFTKKRLISFVIPVHNEQEGLSDFLEHKFFPVTEKLKDYRAEYIFVNDGSTDDTLKIIQDYAAKDKNIKVISFSRNFGKEIALAAGYRFAKGDAVISIDADGQQPPNLIPEFIKKWNEGAEVVTGVRDHYTKHGFIAKTGSKIFYKLLRKMGNEYTVHGSTDYRLIDRVVIDEYNKLTEHNRITRGLIDWLGFKQTNIYYTYGSRMAGKTSYNFSKLFHLALDSFVSMSTTPLMILGYLGAFIMLGSFLLGMFCIINQYILGDPLQLYWDGAVQMTIFITFLVGIILVAQAITALYISHIHAETQGRPLYIIDKKSSRNL